MDSANIMNIKFPISSRTEWVVLSALNGYVDATALLFFSTAEGECQGLERKTCKSASWQIRLDKAGVAKEVDY